MLKRNLIKEILPEKDSLRIYRLGKKNKTNVEHIGTKAAIDVEGELIF